jgi:hypothetical protein
MAPEQVKELKVLTIDGTRCVFAPAGRGEELRLHLASHGFPAALSHFHRPTFDRLDLDKGVDAEAVQAVLDHWEK